MEMSRTDRLAAEGIDVAAMPAGSRQVLDELSDEEFEVLVAMKRRLNSTEDVEAHQMGDSGGLYW
jgi:hypothetical protein